MPKRKDEVDDEDTDSDDAAADDEYADADSSSPWPCVILIAYSTWQRI